MGWGGVLGFKKTILGATMGLRYGGSHLELMRGLDVEDHTWSSHGARRWKTILGAYMRLQYGIPQLGADIGL